MPEEKPPINNPSDFLYSNEAVISQMIFTNCRNWNTPEYPHLNNKHMLMSSINEKTLFVLNDMTVGKINKLCAGCSSFTTDQGLNK